MHSKEPLVQKQSEYFVYQPGATALRIYLYPLITGYFYYEPGYFLQRTNYENYLLMYIAKGELALTYEGSEYRAREGQVVLIDCRRPHAYGNALASVLEVAWLHFDGRIAPDFYEVITESAGPVMSPANPYPFTHHLRRIYEIFKNAAPIQEADVSRRITAMLSALVNAHDKPAGGETPASTSEIVETALAYINEHFREPLTLEMIAANASLSPYYFSRVFSSETGFTPHQYVIATRINLAKYHLQNGSMSIKEIAYLSGFHSESSFCATFRKREGITPGAYRTGTQ